MTLQQQSWNSVAKTLHWLIFFMVLVEVPAGFLMANLYPFGLKYRDVTPLAHLLAQIHHTNGFLLLGVMLARLAQEHRVIAHATRATKDGFNRRVQRLDDAEADRMIAVAAMPSK